MEFAAICLFNFKKILIELLDKENIVCDIEWMFFTGIDNMLDRRWFFPTYRERSIRYSQILSQSCQI